MREMRNEFVHEYNIDVQKFLLNFLISNPDVFVKCRDILQSDYFDDQLAPTARYILGFADQHRTLPKPDLVKAKTGIELTPLDEGEVARQSDWFFTEIEAFCRYRAMENAILDGLKLLREGKAGEVERRIKDSMAISLVSDLGTSYFDTDPRRRIERMMDKSNIISTGWGAIDKKLYGGFTRGALNIFCGYSGSGKSLILQNLALNWALNGANVVYFTVELSEDLSSFRLDSMVTGKGTSEVLKSVDDSSLMIQVKGKKAGRLVVKKMPEGGTTTNTLRAFLTTYQIKTGIKFDAILVDYLDILYPINQTIDVGDHFIKDKFVAEELRALMSETNTYGATASQLNRGAIQAQGEFDHSHIAGGISKLFTADNLFGIWAPDHLKERGEMEIVFMKTRTAASTNSRVKLAYDPKSMRITDQVLGVDDVDRPAPYADLQKELASKVTAKSDQPTEAKEKPRNDLNRLTAMMAKRSNIFE